MSKCDECPGEMREWQSPTDPTIWLRCVKCGKLKPVPSKKPTPPAQPTAGGGEKAIWTFRGGYVEGLDGSRWWSAEILAKAERELAAANAKLETVRGLIRLSLEECGKESWKAYESVKHFAATGEVTP